MKPTAVRVIEVAIGEWSVATATGTKLNLALKNKKAAEQIAKILNDQVEANNIVWAE